MELKVKTPTFPEVIEFNFQELKQEITERAAVYENIVYSEEQIKDAKKDKATLNKFVKALSEERTKIKKECLKPYEDFEVKIKELDGIVNKAIKNIDSQINSYEEQRKQKKLDDITVAFNAMQHPEWLHYSHIFEDRWLNASTSMKSVIDEITMKIEKVETDIETLSNLPEFGFEAQQIYISSLDINKAISEAKRMSEIAKAKAEKEEAMRKIEEEQKTKAAEAEVVAAKDHIEGQVEFTDEKTFDAIVEAAKPKAPVKQWVAFQALLSTDDALALKDFFNSRNIEFKAI